MRIVLNELADLRTQAGRVAFHGQTIAHRMKETTAISGLPDDLRGVQHIARQGRHPTDLFVLLGIWMVLAGLFVVRALFCEVLAVALVAA